MYKSILLAADGSENSLRSAQEVLIHDLFCQTSLCWYCGEIVCFALISLRADSTTVAILPCYALHSLTRHPLWHSSLL